MTIPAMPGLLSEIQLAAASVNLLTQQGDNTDLETLRCEAASLQALIAEARRLQRQSRLAVEASAALFTPTLIETAGLAGFCLVRNLSRSGMRAKAYFALSPGQSVSVHFSSDNRTKGTVISAASDHLDVEFDQPIDVPAVLPASPSKAGRPNASRPARLATHGKGEILVGSNRLPGRLQDISQHGFKMLTSSLKRGDKVSVQLPGMNEKQAVVRWARSGMAGLSFAHLLSFDELGRFGCEGTAACQ